MADFILEIGIEEIPARMLRKAAKDLHEAMDARLKAENIEFESLESHGAPRQITLFGRGIMAAQADRRETVLGPPVRIAYDADGNPTKALEGFLRKNPGISLENLTRVEQKKGDVVAAELFIKGRSTRLILAEALPEILSAMHFAKNMRWRDCPTPFVRPVRNILALFDGEVIPFSFAEIEAGPFSFGHRFHGKARFEVQGIDHYLVEKARQGIVVRHQDRRAAIEQQIQTYLEEVGGLLVPDPALLEEVADLVETPYVVLGSFDEGFLEIPKEVLVTSMREHQKSFTVQDEHGRLLPYFLSVANVPGDGKGLIRKGNEWVLNARLYDAKFFWESDRTKDFDQLRERLKSLMFQQELGSYFAKTERMEALAQAMGEALALEEREALAFAARHAKTDLVSELVFEFPELQGEVGGLLLRHQGRGEAEWRGIYEHYLPMSMDGDLPETRTAALVSLADKLDTLVGCFAIGLIPTGSKDPYALRRAAQGIVRILIEHQLSLSLSDLLARAMENYRGTMALPAALGEQLHGFFVDRMRYFLKRQGFKHDLTEAVLARDTDRVDQTLKRAEAVVAQTERVNFRSLALNLKRMNNVIADESDQLGVFDAQLLCEPVEKELWTRFIAIEPEIKAKANARDYNGAMDKMAELAEPVETYFGTDGVYINVEDTQIRRNRKAMIAQIRDTLGLVADLSMLEDK